MKGYWVARSHIRDAASYKKYTELVPDIVDKFDGRFLARGGQYEVLEGPGHFHRFVLIEFPSVERAVACHRSSDYSKAASYRHGGVGEVELVVTEGLEAGKVDASG